MTDRGQEPIQLRPGSYDERAADVQPAQISSALRSGESRRRFNWGEHPLAEVGLGVTSLLALAGWFAAGILIFMLIADRDGPEGMTGLAVAFSMPQVLVVAFGFTAVAAFMWHRYWGGRVSLVVSIMVALAAAVVPCAWVAVVFNG